MQEITLEYLASQGLSATFPDRFWEKVFILPYDKGCWIWTAAIHWNGYGGFHKGRAVDGHIKAHIASWLLHFGPVPKGLKVLHKCDNPACVNPNHLFLGTQKDNIHDMIRKGRNRHYNPWAGAKCCGNGHPLTEENVCIRFRRGKPARTCRQCEKEAGDRYRRKKGAFYL